jgi:hypothetical protein
MRGASHTRCAARARASIAVRAEHDRDRSRTLTDHGQAPLQTAIPFGQLVGLQPPSKHSASFLHSTMHLFDPGHDTAQSPTHVTSQIPDPVQATMLSGPTVATHTPEPVQATSQPPPHKKSQFPEPAHWRSQSAEQSTRQSPDDGQTQLAPLHSTTPSVPSPPPHPTSARKNMIAASLVIGSPGAKAPHLLCCITDHVG